MATELTAPPFSPHLAVAGASPEAADMMVAAGLAHGGDPRARAAAVEAALPIRRAADPHHSRIAITADPASESDSGRAWQRVKAARRRGRRDGLASQRRAAQCDFAQRRGAHERIWRRSLSRKRSGSSTAPSARSGGSGYERRQRSFATAAAAAGDRTAAVPIAAAALNTSGRRRCEAKASGFVAARRRCSGTMGAR